MAHDVSYHPVDVRFIHDRVIPFVQGGKAIDDLVWKAVLLEQVRFRAHQWGLALMKWKRAHTLDFKPDLHVWGRPFFITTKDPGAIGGLIDRFLKAGPDTVDALVIEMLRELSPELPADVQPRADAKAPSHDELVNRVRWRLDLFRRAYDALGSSRKVEDPKGNKHDPHDLFLGSFPLSAVQFAARFRPGWMSRGRVWPTFIMEKAGLDPAEFFGPPKELFAPIFPRVPALERNLKATIDENRTLGGYVPADKVGALRAHLKENGAALLKYASKEKIDPKQFTGELQKIGEALADAEHRGMAFVEASELYNIPMGIVN